MLFKEGNYTEVICISIVKKGRRRGWGVCVCVYTFAHHSPFGGPQSGNPGGPGLDLG